MTLQITEPLRIRDANHHPRETLNRFQDLLFGGTALQPDPKRPDFFEIRRGEEVFYFYVSPITGEILLLAVWE